MTNWCRWSRYLVVSLAFLTGACAASPDQPALEAAPQPQVTLKSHGSYVVGNPYRVAGRLYTPAVDYDYDRTGNASWYGNQFHHRKTANGERCDQNALTAAHPTLPLPSVVRVTNLENGRSLVVRINDRGPFVRGRVLDVSKKAAKMLAFHDKGVTRVRVQVLEKESREAAVAAGAKFDFRQARAGTQTEPAS